MVYLTFITFITKQSYVTSVYTTSVHVLTLLAVATITTDLATFQSIHIVVAFFIKNQENKARMKMISGAFLEWVIINTIIITYHFYVIMLYVIKDKGPINIFWTFYLYGNIANLDCSNKHECLIFITLSIYNHTCAKPFYNVSKGIIIPLSRTMKKKKERNFNVQSVFFYIAKQIIM